MPCLFRYRWLKLPRAALPQGKGLSAYWARLAARAAFRKGVASYCGHENPVEPGMWSGGVVGLKSILGVKKRERALEILEQLSSHGYLSYELNSETKQLSYRITDWEMDHCGSECESGNVYTTPGYGFLCVPRRIAEKLLSLPYYKYEESDAFRLGVEFCVSDIRQSQEWRCRNRAEKGLNALLTSAPEARDGMRASA